ncbi:MAG: right-handed parallel beta-helix repeat-containing protein [Thermus sp.]|uniref:right-handed parallel beta-helix repeat-containing protein n=1 Tax=Thermus sp. TaxID=275 RepID=UPI003D117B8E
MRLLGLFALFGLAFGGGVLELSGEIPGPLVLSTPGLEVEGKGAWVRGGKGHAVLLLAPGIRVRGLRVVGAGAGQDFFEPDAAFYLGGCAGCALEGVRAEGAFTAVRVEDSPGARVVGLEARGPDSPAPGVLVYRSPNALIARNRLSGYMDAVYVEYSPGTAIRENLLEGNGRYGFHVMFSWEVRVEANTSRNNAVGNAVMHGAANRVVGNRLSGQKSPVGYGLLVQDEKGTEVRGNTFQENTLGLVLMDAKEVAVRENRFLENGTGLRITRERGGNSALVEGNAFRGNLYDLLVDDPEAKARVVGNAYDRASGLPSLTFPPPALPFSSPASLNFPSSRLPRGCCSGKGWKPRCRGLGSRALPTPGPRSWPNRGLLPLPSSSSPFWEVACGSGGGAEQAGAA